MHSTDLKNYMGGLKQLPTLPPVASKLIETAGQSDCSIEEVSRLIQSDQSVAAKILRLANSAHFGSSRQVTTIDRAVTLLGLDLVRNSALSIMIYNVMKTSSSDLFHLDEFWRHSAACAIFGEQLARRMGYPRPQEIFLAGLMHDMGKLVFVNWNRPKLEQAISDALADRRRLLEVEEEQIGMGHTRAGKIIMEYWNFPDNLVKAAWLHHQPYAQLKAHANGEIAGIVHCANSLCHLQRFGDSGNPLPDMSMDEVMQATGLTNEQLTDLSAQAMERLEDLSKCFDWDADPVQLYLSAVSRANDELARMNVQMAGKNRRLVEQHSLLEAICELQQQLSANVPLGNALERIVQSLGKALPFQRVMGFLILEREGLIEGCLKRGEKGDVEKISLPLEPAEKLELKNLNSGQSFSLIEKAALRLGEGLAVASEIMEALKSANMIVLPLEAGGIVLGQLVVQFGNNYQSTNETVELLGQYSRAAVMALERVMLFERLEQQSDDMARMARKGQETQSRLNQAERLASVGRLAAGAAHEINNPLAAISAQAQLMLRRTKDEKNTKSLDAVIEQCNRISKIIGDLMGFARPAEPKIEPTLIKTVIDNALSVIENRIRVAGIEIKKEYEKDLPLIQADAKQLEQVFLNLAVNAMQAMDKGGSILFRVTNVKDRRQVRIDVSDTGPGIDSKIANAIFDPFFTTKEEGEGTGLGLAICHSIVESHQGKITVSSQPGKGTTFTILLPAGSVSSVESIRQKQKSPALKAVEGGDKGAGQVLIIDDEEALRLVLSESCRHEGYDVDTAVDGMEGLEKLSRKHYDCVLLDLRMPRKEGMEVLEVTRKKAPDIPVIVISGLARENELKAAMDAGAFASFKKPFNIGEILGTLKRAIKTRKNRTQRSNNQTA
jgi:signal transduction histidine kinase/HD-like signal output (HDOD) protein/ActR/RegA family two-component response regulator